MRGPCGGCSKGPCKGETIGNTLPKKGIRTKQGTYVMVIWGTVARPVVVFPLTLKRFHQARRTQDSLRWLKAC